MTARYERIDARALGEALTAPRRPVLVDVRDRAAFEAARIPGSRHVPVHAMGEQRARLPASLAERLIVIGDDASRTHAAANFLVLIGFGDVAVLDGGVATWPGHLNHGTPPDEPCGGPILSTVK